MQAAGLLKEKATHDHSNVNIRVKTHRPMAKPVLVATITQDDSNMATIIKEAKDGMSWITENVKVGRPARRGARSCRLIFIYVQDLGLGQGKNEGLLRSLREYGLKLYPSIALLLTIVIVGVIASTKKS